MSQNLELPASEHIDIQVFYDSAENPLVLKADDGELIFTTAEEEAGNKELLAIHHAEMSARVRLGLFRR